MRCPIWVKMSSIEAPPIDNILPAIAWVFYTLKTDFCVYGVFAVFISDIICTVFLVRHSVRYYGGVATGLYGLGPP